MESVIPLITHPISLCAYIISLAFGLATIRTSGRAFYLAAFLSVIALVGGLVVSWQQLNTNQSHTASAGASKTDTIEQKPAYQSTTSQASQGNQSPNISGVGGDVNIKYGADGSTPQEKK